MKPYIVDVYLCVPDETYYPLVGRSKYNDANSAQSQHELVQMLLKDGWEPYGLYQMIDGSQRQLFQKNHKSTGQDLIAIAEEN